MPATTVHNILDPRLWSGEPYPSDNAVGLCAHHKDLCEVDVISVKEIRSATGISCLPSQLYSWLEYDRWGNPLYSDGTRSKGELFDEPDVQRILSQYSKLELFGQRVRYPKTFVLPWSESMSDGDHRMRSASAIEESDVVATEKFDGQNVTLYRDSFFFRSIAARTHPSRQWLEEFWSDRRNSIPKGWRICGEYLYLCHTVAYHDLASFFIGFSVWNEENICLSWMETEEFLQDADIACAPVMYSGKFNLNAIRGSWVNRRHLETEGYVLRVAGRIRFRDFKTKVGKFIRAGYAQSDPLRSHVDAEKISTNELSLR